jgi:CheY-like chemotaxis protein
MKVDISEIKEKLRRELANLTATFDGDKKKVNRMTQSILDDIAPDFEKLRYSISNEKSEELLTLLHKLKPRYGYLGQDRAMDEMAQWENEIRVLNDNDKNLRRLNYFEKVNELITKELTQIKLEQTAGLPTEQATLPLIGKKVLVAEDDEVNAMVFELFIEELGGSVFRATDGNQAVLLTSEHQPDLIFMDVHMPYFSGVEAIKLIRLKNATIPIISLSASTRLQEKQQSLDAGATSFLNKPVKREAIHQVLLMYLT